MLLARFCVFSVGHVRSNRRDEEVTTELTTPVTQVLMHPIRNEVKRTVTLTWLMAKFPYQDAFTKVPASEEIIANNPDALNTSFHAVFRVNLDPGRRITLTRTQTPPLLMVDLPKLPREKQIIQLRMHLILETQRILEYTQQPSWHRQDSYRNYSKSKTFTNN